MKRICSVCNKEFEADVVHATYTGDAVSSENTHMNIDVPNTCPECKAKEENN